MEPVRVYVFPALMITGALWLALVELRHFRYEHAIGHSPWTRLVRRLMGAVVLLAVAVMIHFGETSTAVKLTQEQAIARFHYWMSVLGLVVFAMGLALWDVIDSLRKLGSYLEEVERDEMHTLRQRLKERNS